MHRLTLFIVLLSCLTFPLTITGASVALPGIAGDLGADLAATQWVVNGYNACFASFLVFTGSLADVLGRRRVFAVGVALFCLSSAASAFAGDVGLLNALRALGGVGAAAATTGGTAILAATFDGQARARAFGLLGTVLGAGLAFGPTAGGLLVEALGWRAVFAVPAAIALLVLLLTSSLPAQPLTPQVPGQAGAPSVARRRLDWPGAALFTGALLLVIFALDEGPALGFGSPLILGALVAAVALGTAFVVVERRSAAPMVELGLLANRSFLAYAVAAAALMAVLVPLVVYLPSYLISGLGLGAGEAGAWLLMLTIPSLLLPSVGAILARRVQERIFVAGCVTLAGAGALLLVTLGPDSTPLTLCAPFVLVGAGVGLSTGVLDGLAISTVRPAQAGTASGMFNTARLVTETVMLAVVGALLAAVSAGQLRGNGFTEAFHVVSLVLGCFAAVAAICVAVLSRRG